MKRATLRRRSRAAMLLVAVLALSGALFLWAIGIDALEQKNAFQFYADSSTYHEIARGSLDLDTLGDIVGIAGNFLGPLVVLRLAGESYYFVLVLNVLLLAFSVSSLARSLGADPLKLLLVLLLNPMTVSSVLSVNKEILSLVFVALLVRAYAARSVTALLVAALVSVLVRWQLTILLLVTVAMIGGVNPLRHHRGWSLLLLLAGLSVAYVQFAETLAPIRLTFEEAAAEYEGSGLYEQLVTLQASGLYWAIFPVKAAHLLFGMGLRLDRLVQPTDVYNDFWQLLHSTTTLLLFLLLLRARRVTLANDLFYLSLIYIAVFAITPIYTPRYFYPVYLLWAAALCAPARRLSLAGIAAARPPRRRLLRRPSAPAARPHLAP